MFSASTANKLARGIVSDKNERLIKECQPILDKILHDIQQTAREGKFTHKVEIEFERDDQDFYLDKHFYIKQKIKELDYLIDDSTFSLSADLIDKYLHKENDSDNLFKDTYMVFWGHKAAIDGEPDTD